MKLISHIAETSKWLRMDKRRSNETLDSGNVEWIEGGRGKTSQDNQVQPFSTSQSHATPRHEPRRARYDRCVQGTRNPLSLGRFLVYPSGRPLRLGQGKRNDGPSILPLFPHDLSILFQVLPGGLVNTAGVATMKDCREMHGELLSTP